MDVIQYAAVVKRIMYITEFPAPLKYGSNSRIIVYFARTFSGGISDPVICIVFRDTSDHNFTWSLPAIFLLLKGDDPAFIYITGIYGS